MSDLGLVGLQGMMRNIRGSTAESILPTHVRQNAFMGVDPASAPARESTGSNSQRTSMWGMYPRTLGREGNNHVPASAPLIGRNGQPHARSMSHPEADFQAAGVDQSLSQSQRVDRRRLSSPPTSGFRIDSREGRIAPDRPHPPPMDTGNALALSFNPGPAPLPSSQLPSVDPNPNPSHQPQISAPTPIFSTLGALRSWTLNTS